PNRRLDLGPLLRFQGKPGKPNVALFPEPAPRVNVADAIRVDGPEVRQDLLPRLTPAPLGLHEHRDEGDLARLFHPEPTAADPLAPLPSNEHVNALDAVGDLRPAAVVPVLHLASDRGTGRAARSGASVTPPAAVIVGPPVNAGPPAIDGAPT